MQDGNEGVNLGGFVDGDGLVVRGGEEVGSGFGGGEVDHPPPVAYPGQQHRTEFLSVAAAGRSVIKSTGPGLPPARGGLQSLGLAFVAMSLAVGRGWRDLLATVPAVTAMVATTIGAGLPAPIEPSISRDFPDPTVLSVGGTYYAYSTASRYGGRTFHVPVRHSTRLTGGWSDARDALPELPAWVDTTAPGEGSVWAPALTGSDDGYLLYFTARSASQRAQCIGVAWARAPQGPFHSIGSHPLVCQPGDSDEIDPKPFTDTDRKRYLLYSATRGGNATIWLQQLTAEGTDTIGHRRAVIRADRADEAHVVEAPTILRHGGRYVLFYSANAYDGGHYFINYATADTLRDEFVKHPGQFLNQHTLDDAYQNPGGQDVLHTHRHDFLVFHADTTPASRGMFVVGMGWDQHDHPVVVLVPAHPHETDPAEPHCCRISGQILAPGSTRRNERLPSGADVADRVRHGHALRREADGSVFCRGATP